MQTRVLTIAQVMVPGGRTTDNDRSPHGWAVLWFLLALTLAVAITAWWAQRRGRARADAENREAEEAAAHQKAREEGKEVAAKTAAGRSHASAGSAH